MTASEKFELIKRACREQKVCEVRYRDERVPRYVHPLGICLTFNRGLVIVCCMEEQRDGKGGSPTLVLKNLPMEDCHQMRIMDEKFKILPDFIDQAKICDDWLFHV